MFAEKPSYGNYEDNQDNPRNTGTKWSVNFDSKTLIGILSLNVAILKFYGSQEPRTKCDDLL